MDQSKERIRRVLKLIAKDKSAVERMLKHDESPKRPLSKSAQLSEEFRDSGNQLYIQDGHCPSVHFQILQYYNKSIAYAPTGSEILALAFGSKSALLRHLGKYKECICELDKALEITESTCLKIKLLCRKAECLTALGSLDNESCLQKANFFLAKLQDLDRMKTSLSKLISKAQSTVNNNKFNRPAEDSVKNQAIKLIAKIKKYSIWDSVKIEYSKKYGRHSVAARDFEPGEIVSVEKPYQNYLMGDNAFEYCCYCLELLWAAFPCENCSSRLFCSEQCKSRALSEYHDMECPALLHMDKMIPLEKYNDIPFITSIFFKALKEAGSVDQLKNDLESLDKLKTGMCAKTYSQSEKLTSYKNVYTVPVRKIDESELNSCAKSCAMALIGLAESTQIFNQSYGLRDLQMLRKDDVAIFVGALLFKFCSIITGGCYANKLADPEDLDESPEDDPDNKKCPCEADAKDPKSVSVVVTSLMTLIGCFPNVGHCIVHGNKLILYALRPIREGDKLCSFTSSSIYEYAPKSERQSFHRVHYNCPCDCRACTERWSERLRDDTKLKEICDAETKKSVIGAKLNKEMDIITNESTICTHTPNRPDLETLSKAKRLVSKAWRHFRMPSPLIIESTRIMKDLFSILLGVPEIPPGLLWKCGNNL